MRIINLKTRNIKISSNLKMIAIMTLIILAMLIILPLIFLRNDTKTVNVFNLNNISINKSSEILFPHNGKVKVYIKEDNKVEEIDLEEYIMGVVASEVPASFNEEALKAQAIAARTFYMNRRNNNCIDAKNKSAEICNTTHCQVYMDKNKAMSKWSSTQAENNWDKIQKAVVDTKGQILTYEDSVLEYPQFFAISSGKTEDAKDVFSISVPYLKSEDSLGEEVAPKYKTTKVIPGSEFVSKINEKYPNVNIRKNNLASMIKIDSYNESGSVKEIKIGNQIIKGIEFRKIFNLSSTNFKINFEGNNVKVNCIGYGHGVGMSQWGANIMGKNGATYDEILKHYYTGVEIQKIKYTH